ncbi:amino acid permease/ SLC12A domain-containing protein [Tricladium varicosporioides]|nr:amino acid permease/ SLC12A domain-containing protein [Hymenoscyphus varicosporioides]
MENSTCNSNLDADVEDEWLQAGRQVQQEKRSRKGDNTELRRCLNERHVNMIAFSSTIGIGLFLQSGKVMYLIGPGGAVLAYLLMGSVLWSANASLGEMTAVFPVKGPIIDFPSRFVDEGVGFAVGWMAWFAYINLTATEVSAVASLFKFKFESDYLTQLNYPRETLQWDFGLGTNPAVWVTLCLVGILLINLLPVRAYGEIEYVCGCIKMFVIVSIIILNVALNARNSSRNNTSPFQFYQQPLGFFSNQTTTDPGARTYTFTGDTGRLVGMWSAMNTIFFSLQGFFTVSVTAAENKHVDRDESIKLATRKISLRVILLYVLVVFTVGLNVPYDDSNLRDQSISSIRRGQNSPVIIACIRSGLVGLPHFFNAFYIFSAFSTGVNGLYIASRLLHALASIRNVWPATGWGASIKARLAKTSSKGVPVNAVFTSWLFGLMGYLAVKPYPAKILGRMAIFSTSSMLIVYACVAIAFLLFRTRTITGDPSEDILIRTPEGEFLNRDAPDYPYKSHLQWLRSAYALLACLLLIIFNGWRTFLSPFSHADFLSAYMSIPIFITIVALYHFKDEPEWKPWRWERRVTMEVGNPVVTVEKDPEKRKGRLHRANRDDFWCKENLAAFGQFVWTWLK